MDSRIKYKIIAFLCLLALATPVRTDAALIDDIAGATFAFSLSRYINSSYSGEVVRLRANANDAESDFKLNGSNVLVTDDVNEQSVSAWLAAQGGSDTAYVVTVYDQSGNGRNFTQATAARQPTLVQNSDLNGLAAIDFSGTNNTKLASAASITISAGSGIEVHAIVRPTSVSGESSIFSSFASSLAHVGGNATLGWSWQADNADLIYGSAAPVNGSNYAMSWRYFGVDDFNIYENGEQIMTSGDPATAMDWRTGNQALGNAVATDSGSQLSWKGLIAELIFYNGTYSSDDFQNIEDSLMQQAGLADPPDPPDPPTATSSDIYINNGGLKVNGGRITIR